MPAHRVPSSGTRQPSAVETIRATGEIGRMSGFSPEDFLRIFDELRDYIAVHGVMLDDEGNVVDTRLKAWNRAYAEVRTEEVLLDQSILDTYIDPEHAIFFVDRAWNTGSVHEVFEFTAATRDTYQPGERIIMLDVHWQRIGDYIVEIGTDLSEIRLLQMELVDQESVAAQALRARVSAEARERLARDLHDSVLQQLFASVLQLGVIAEADDPARYRTEIRTVVQALTGAISEIRHGINHFDLDEPSSLARELEDAAGLVTTAAGVHVSVVVASGVDCSGELRSNLRLVTREAISNAVRHGHCAHANVTVLRDDDRLVVRIADDGIGIGTEQRLESGLRNMRRRAEQFGGTMSIEPGSEGGTLLVWSVPYPHGGTSGH